MPLSLSSSSIILATSASAMAPASSWIVERSLFSSCAEDASRDSSKSCSVPFEAVSKNSTFLSIKAPGKKNLQNVQIVAFGGRVIPVVVTCEQGSFGDAVGIMRKAVSAKLDGDVYAFVGRVRELLWPFTLSDSSTINSLLRVLMIMHGAGEIALTPESLQESLKNVENDRNAPPQSIHPSSKKRLA